MLLVRIRVALGESVELICGMPVKKFGPHYCMANAIFVVHHILSQCFPETVHASVTASDILTL